MMDAFDRWWQWAEKRFDSGLTLPADIHHAVTSLAPEARYDRAKVNEAVRPGAGHPKTEGTLGLI
jgi:hypothetical protein